MESMSRLMHNEKLANKHIFILLKKVVHNSMAGLLKSFTVASLLVFSAL